MYVDYLALKSAIENGERSYANFYDTYGFLVIRNVLSRVEFKECVKEYDSEYKRRTGEESILKMLVNRMGLSGPKKYGLRKIASTLFRKGMAFLPCFAEESKHFTNMLASKKMTEMFRYFCGENWLYLGSDGSRFATTSFPWHRDWCTKTELMKCNFYFNTLPFFGGRFLVIPGSHAVTGIYARRIQKSISWPLQNKNPTGMNENDFIPRIVNPRKGFSVKDIFIWKEKFDVPHTKLRIRKGDLVIFDQRIMHCVETSLPQVTRRLMTFLIAKNAFDFPGSHELFDTYTREEIMTDLLDLVVNERNHIGCPPWGNEYEKCDLVNSNHYIKIEKTDGSEKYNRASIQAGDDGVFQSTVDFEYYSRLGSEYRSKFADAQKSVKDKHAKEFSCQDVHLGINCQNLKW